MAHTLKTRHIANRRQRGAALIVMLVIVVMGAAAFLVSSLSSSGLQIARDRKTAEVLAQAKEAIIGKAVIANDNDPAKVYVGGLYCPDTNDDGVSDAGGSTECPQYIGRLPWKTLGLPDLRDAAGERLWYTLSRNVRRYSSVRPLNSDTTGTLNITGTYAASNVIAIVFAPGANTGNQSRSASQMASCTTTGDTREQSRCAANYLEGSNANPSPGATPNQNYQSSDANIPFNDQIISISRDQLFQPVEKRVGNEIRKILNTYYAAWGAYPFAAPFADPSTSNYTGQASPATYSGLLPINDQSYIPTWAATPSISFAGGSPTPSMGCMLRDGYDYPDARWRCCNLSAPDSCSGTNITIPSGATVTITGTLRNVGHGFWRPHHIDNVCEVRARNSSGNTVQAASLFAPGSVSVAGRLNSDGSATVVFRATGRSGGTTLQRIELRDIRSYHTDIKTYTDSSTCPAVSSSSPIIPTWLFNDPTYGNNWHQLAYYAVSPGGGNSCNPLPGTPSCLTVNGGGGGNDKRAVVVMAGAALAGQAAHPNGTLANYLEGENATPANFIYENKTRSGTFNDQVIIVAP